MKVLEPSHIEFKYFVVIVSQRWMDLHSVPPAQYYLLFFSWFHFFFTSEPNKQNASIPCNACEIRNSLSYRCNLLRWYLSAVPKKSKIIFKNEIKNR